MASESTPALLLTALMITGLCVITPAQDDGRQEKQKAKVLGPVVTFHVIGMQKTKSGAT